MCMNRLSFLRETLPANIEQNIDNPDLEFVVLDYNSPDGMEEWAKREMQPYTQSGILKYYKTHQPVNFHLSHSKNMALRLASGEIVCLVDADNFAGKGYGRWIQSVFTAEGQNTIVTNIRKDNIPFRDQGGKISFHHDLLHAVRGFDESLVGYGVDDVDLVNRLEKVGGKRYFLTDPGFMKFIGHSTLERVKNFHLINNLSTLYIKVSDSMKIRSTVLYLMNDNSFTEVLYEFDKSLEKNNVLSYGGWNTRRDGYRKGTYDRQAGKLSLLFEDGSALSYFEQGKAFIYTQDGNTKQLWKNVSRNEDLFHYLIMSYGECLNRLIYLENDKKMENVNVTGWGEGTVFLNFDNNTPIRITGLTTTATIPQPAPQLSFQ